MPEEKKITEDILTPDDIAAFGDFHDVLNAVNFGGYAEIEMEFDKILPNIVVDANNKRYARVLFFIDYPVDEDEDE